MPGFCPLLRITIITGPFLPLPPASCGAVEQVWQGLAEQFAALGHDVTILCRAHPTQRHEEKRNGVYYRRRTQFTRTKSLKLDLVKDGLYSLRMLPVLPYADVLVTNVFWLPVAASLLHARGRVVVNVQRMPKGQIRLYHRVARLAAVSRAVRQAIAEQCPKALPLTKVIPNPIDTDILRPPPQGRSLDGPQTILYTGRIHPEKGLGLLIEAFGRIQPRFPQARLELVGPWQVESGGGGEAYLRQLRDQALGLPVTFGEPIYNRADLARLLQRAHVYCYPSLADEGESFGVAPLEAMATGLAPIVSDLFCFRDFIKPGQNGIIFDHRASDASDKLAVALASQLSDPQRRVQMGETAALDAADFSYANIARMYLEDFRGLLC